MQDGSFAPAGGGQAEPPRSGGPGGGDAERSFVQGDFEHIAASLLQNEELGEKRVAFFTALVGSLFAGVGFLLSDLDGAIPFDPHAASAAASALLLVVGLLVLARLRRRNAVTDGYKRILGEMRKLLAPEMSSRYRTLFAPGGRTFWTGGHTQVVAVLNSALAAMLFWAGGRACGWTVGAWAIVVAVAALVAQLLATGRRSAESGGAAFRASVGLVVLDRDGRALAIERRDTRDAWQFPQGGLRQGEEAIDAAYRELQEETGLDRSDVALLAIHPRWLAYELPEPLRKKKTGLGQVQRWFAFRLVAGDAGVRLGREARAWAWKPLDDVARSVVEFRRPAYAEVVAWVRQIQEGAAVSDASRRW